jgi:hypothetical protein
MAAVVPWARFRVLSGPLPRSAVLSGEDAGLLLVNRPQLLSLRYRVHPPVLPVWVSWMLAAHFMNPGLFATISVERKSSARIEVRRVDLPTTDTG